MFSSVIINYDRDFQVRALQVERGIFPSRESYQNLFCVVVKGYSLQQVLRWFWSLPHPFYPTSWDSLWYCANWILLVCLDLKCVFIKCGNILKTYKHYSFSDMFHILFSFYKKNPQMLGYIMYPEIYSFPYHFSGR